MKTRRKGFSKRIYKCKKCKATCQYFPPIVGAPRHCGVEMTDKGEAVVDMWTEEKVRPQRGCKCYKF